MTTVVRWDRYELGERDFAIESVHDIRKRTAARLKAWSDDAVTATPADEARRKIADLRVVLAEAGGRR